MLKISTIAILACLTAQAQLFNSGNATRLKGKVMDSSVSSPSAGCYIQWDNAIPAYKCAAAPGGGGSGDVVGPASATSGNIATYNGTTGKIIQDGGKALPSGVVVGTTDAQTLTNKTLTAPSISDFSSAGHSHQNAAGGGTLDASAIGSGTVATARLGSGTANSSTVLHGDNVWRSVEGCIVSKVSGTVIRVATPCNWRYGNTRYELAGDADIEVGTSPTGTSTVHLYFTSSLWAGHQTGGASLSCNANCTVVGSSIASFNDARATAGASVGEIATAAYTNSVFADPVSVKTLLGVQNVGVGASGNLTATLGSGGQTQIDTSANISYAGVTTIRPFAHYASDPATCSVGMTIFNTTSNTPKYCSATNTWSTYGGGSAVTILRMPLAGTSTGGTPHSSGWVASGSTGLAYPHSDSAILPGGAEFANPSADSSDVATWFDLPSGYTGGSITVNAWGYAGSGGSNGQVVKLEFRAACITAGTTSINTTSYGGATTMTITLADATAAMSQRGTITLAHGSCTADKQVKMAVRRLDAADTLAARFVLTNVTVVIP